MSANVINAAAKSLNLDPSTLSVPVVKLVDETSFITVEMSGKTSEKSRDNANAIKDAFFTQLNILREDELKRREDSISETVKKYGNEVNSIRSQYNALQVTSGLNSIDQYNTIVNANENLKVKLADSESALAKVEERLKKELDLSPEAAVITMKLHADPEFTVLIDAAAKAEADYAQASEQFGSNHPKLVDARNKYGGLKRKMESRAAQVTGLNFSSLRKQIDFSAAGQGSTMMAQLLQFNTERQGLEAQNAALRSQFEKQQNYIVSMAPIVSKMENINRDYKLAEAVFTVIITRILR